MKNTTPLSSAVIAMSIALSSPSISTAETTDLISRFNPRQGTVAGDWTKSDGTLRVAAAKGSRCVLTEVRGDYDLLVEFTRPEGEDAVGLILPIGSKQCVLELSGWRGEAHGLARIDELPSRAPENPTSVRPGNLENGERHRVEVQVRVKGDAARVAARLDGDSLFDFTGAQSRFEPHRFYTLPSRESLGLVAASTAVVFHKVELKAESTSMPLVDELATIEFEGRRFVTELADAVTVEPFADRQALHVVGGEPAYVFLPNVELQDGTIEVDIASNTFSGIGFRGGDGGKKFEMIYFRPQNSGTDKHDKTVQYVAKGRADGAWRYLRENFPGKYEAGADMRVNQWFHARLEIAGATVRVFVDDAPKPVLVVDEMLYGTSRGTVGLWGWNSYFANFQFTPAD